MSAPRLPEVIVHLTPFAPGCETAGVDAKARNRTFWATPLTDVLASVLRRLHRTAAEITAVQSGDEIDLMATVQGLDGPERQPLAVIWAGADLAQVQAALSALSTQTAQGAAA